MAARWALQTSATVLPVDELMLTLGNDIFTEPAELALTHRLAVLLAVQEREVRAHRQSLGIRPVWLSGKVTGKKREAALARIAGGAELVIGTHALMQLAANHARRILNGTAESPDRNLRETLLRVLRTELAYVPSVCGQSSEATPVMTQIAR